MKEEQSENSVSQKKDGILNKDLKKSDGLKHGTNKKNDTIIQPSNQKDKEEAKDKESDENSHFFKKHSINQSVYEEIKPLHGSPYLNSSNNMPLNDSNSPLTIEPQIQINDKDSEYTQSFFFFFFFVFTFYFLWVL